jgi:hypothetical protein
MAAPPPPRPAAAAAPQGVRACPVWAAAAEDAAAAQTSGERSTAVFDPPLLLCCLLPPSCAAQRVCAASTSSAGSRPEAHVWFLGPRGSGKSTLITRVLYPNRVRAPRRGRWAELGVHFPADRRARAARHSPGDSPPNPTANQGEAPPPSDAVEYTFARRASGAGAGGGPDTAHFWEMGGQEGVAMAVMGAGNAFLTPKTVGGWQRD